MPRTVRCTSATRAGRLRKAQQFHEASAMVVDLADDAEDVGDAYVTLLVHAGIAAADVICCARLGVYASGESHWEARDLLGRVDRRLADDLATLLGVKTKAGYDHRPVSTEDRRRAARSNATRRSRPRRLSRRRASPRRGPYRARCTTAARRTPAVYDP